MYIQDFVDGLHIRNLNKNKQKIIPKFVKFYVTVVHLIVLLVYIHSTKSQENKKSNQNNKKII